MKITDLNTDKRESSSILEQLKREKKVEVQSKPIKKVTKDKSMIFRFSEGQMNALKEIQKNEGISTYSELIEMAILKAYGVNLKKILFQENRGRSKFRVNLVK